MTDPTPSIESLLAAAEAAAAAGDLDATRRAIEEALRGDPNGIEVGERLGALLAVLGRHLEAADRFERAALEAGRVASGASIRAGVARFRSGRRWEGLEWLGELSGRLPEYHRIARQVAELRLSVGDVYGAIEDLTTRLEAEPTDARSHIALGDTLVRIDAYQRAAICYRRAAELEPDRKAPSLRLRRIRDRLEGGAADGPLDAAARAARLADNLVALARRHPDLATFLRVLPRPSEWTTFAAGGAIRAADRGGRWVDGYYGPPRTGPAPGQGPERLERCPVFLGVGLGYGLARFLSATATIDDLPGKLLPVYVVEPDADLFRLALEIHDLSSDLASGRLVPFVGPGAVDRAVEFFSTLDGATHQFPVILSELAGGRARSFLARFEETRRRTDRRTALQLAALRSEYAARDADLAPRRVLGWVRRHETEAYRTALEAVRELQARGLEVRLLTETEPTGWINLQDLVQAVDEFRPDRLICFGRTAGQSSPLDVLALPTSGCSGPEALAGLTDITRAG